MEFEVDGLVLRDLDWIQATRTLREYCLEILVRGWAMLGEESYAREK